MEVLIIVILIGAVLFLLITRSKSTSTDYGGTNATDDLAREIQSLAREVKLLKYQVEDSAKAINRKIDGLAAGEVSGVAAPAVADIPVPELIYVPQEDTQFTPEPIREDAVAQPEPVDEPAVGTFDVSEPIQQPKPVASFSEPAAERQWQQQESGFDKWMRNNPDLEKFIGENLINKIGIAVLVLGIAFFVKYAIDQNWINEVGRVCIGLGCGAILVGLAHYLRNSYRSFSSVLAGGGIAVFYFTIAFGFHQYHLMSQTAAFLIMVVITAFAIALSVLYDKLELAIIATIGGFITPFLVSTGDGNYTVLFTYLIILNIGVLALSYFKRWPAINIIALFFTEIIFGAWLVKSMTETMPHFSYPVALSFASAFYFIFLGMNMINQVRNQEHFKPFDLVILLLISSSYFTAGIAILHLWNGGEYQGIFTLGLGLVNLALAYYVYKNGKADKILLFLLIGITLTFITLTIPIQMHGHAITLFWSAEFVLLYWLSEYSGIRLFKLSSLLIALLSLVSLFMDWEQAGAASTLNLEVIYTNIQGIVTNVVAIAAFALWAFLLQQHKEEDVAGIPNTSTARITLLISVGLLYVTCIFGVNLFFGHQLNYTVPNVYHRMITTIFALVIVVLAQRKTINISPWFQFLCSCICFVFLLASSQQVMDLTIHVTGGQVAWAHMVAHWVDCILLGVLFYKTIQGLRRHDELSADTRKVLSVVFTIMIVTFLSLELLHVYMELLKGNHNINALTQQYSKAGLTVIWALCSFALMWLGMKYSEKPLRIISLVLFSIVLLKLFLFDISDISEGGKILAFILLGILLLTVSFMYQKLKKMIIDDKKE